jgi:hypothetical protein
MHALLRSYTVEEIRSQAAQIDHAAIRRDRILFL